MDNGQALGTQATNDRQSEFFRDSTNTDFADAARHFDKDWEGKIKVLIAEPTIGMIDYRAHEACCDLMFNLARFEGKSKYKFFKTCLGRLMTQYAREMFAEYAVNMGFDYIMYIDDDHIWQPDMFEKLEKHLKDYDIVAPLCCQRSKPYYPVLYSSEFKKDDKGNITSYINHNYCENHTIKKGDIITDADAIGFGAAIVNVNVFRRTPQPWFMSMAPIGEDILFCMKAKQAAGLKICVDTNVEAPHMKESDIIDFRTYQEEMAKCQPVSPS